MNRQQRRLAQRQAEARKRAEDRIVERQGLVSDVMIEQFYTAAGLALHELYGFGSGRIGKVWELMNRIIGSIDEDVDQFYEIKRELKDKTGCEVRMIDKEGKV